MITLKRLPTEVITGIAANLLAALLIGLWSKWAGLICGCVAFLCLGVFLYRRYKGLFNLIGSGASEYHRNFPPEQSNKVFQTAKESFGYLGLSTKSINQYIRGWLESNSSLKSYKILLMHPDSPHLERLKAFERGISLGMPLSDKDQRQIAQDVAAEKKYIEAGIGMLKSFPQYGRSLEIRLYKEFIPYWLYLIDGKKIYVGMYAQGQGKEGPNSSVIVVQEILNFTSLFDAFKNTWDFLWENGENIS
jgi:hypothetical protein